MKGTGEEIEQEVKEPELSKGGIRGNREVKKEGDERRGCGRCRGIPLYIDSLSGSCVCWAL